MIGFALLVLGSIILIIVLVCTTPSTTSNGTNFHHIVVLENVTSEVAVKPSTLEVSVPEVSAEMWLADFFADTLPEWKIPDNHLLIGSAHCTDARFVEAQFASIKAFVKNDFTYFVINDVKKKLRPDRYEAIVETCERNNIKHITFHPGLHDDRTILLPDTDQKVNDNASARASDVVQFMVEIFQTHNGYALMLDSDCVIINSFNPHQELSPNYSYAGPHQTKWCEKRQTWLDYVWIVVILFDMAAFPHPEFMNLDCGRIDEVQMDTGGMWNTYIQKTNNIPRYFREVWTNPHMQDIKRKFPRVECFENLFLHFHNGSQWEGITDADHHMLVGQWLETVKEIIQERTS